MIAANDALTILIAKEGNKIAGPATVKDQLSFSNGEAQGRAPGVLAVDNPGDNFSTTTCKVIK